MNSLETYLTELGDIHASGANTPETAYYAPLAALLNETGKTFKPQVRCFMGMKNQGAGMPDGGFFTRDQFRKTSDLEPLPGQLPARGVIEVKGAGDPVDPIAASPQVAQYLDKYGQVLVTNLREFVLVGREQGQLVKLERYSLAASEAEFWAAVAHPRKLAAEHGERLAEYLQRVMLHAAPLTAPADVAWFLASYARDARARLEHAQLPALDAIRAALEEALGIQFEGTKGEHFFHSTLIQTLFYGVFSAWVLWHKSLAKVPEPWQGSFDWRISSHYLRVPVLQTLFHQVSDPHQLKSLGLMEALDWTAAALNRVEREAFFASFDAEAGHAVQYFYEPFLQAFDPELRKELGVWYTPPEIVQYMVARVDTVLREELDRPDGLADPDVYVLDPCCGTGTYLVEVLRRIGQTLRDKGGDALVAADLKHAVMEHVFGFEILPAPFVIAHLQLGLMLQSLGAPLAEDKNERVGVYLTNALTGWEPPHGPKKSLTWPDLQAERDIADRVKRETKILVVLGNPPYNAFADIAIGEEADVVKPYKEGLVSEWGIKKYNLDDLYVRFFRLAERRIAEMTGKGVVCYISNYSWLSDPSFVVLRKHLLESFDRFWVENMHGDRKISEYAPDGKSSETIFAISGFSPGIQQGVAISLWVKSGKTYAKKILFNDNLNAARAVERRAHLLQSLSAPNFDAQYETAHPDKSNRYSFRPSDVSAHYTAWPKLTELCEEAPMNGLMEKRGGALMNMDQAALEKRMRMYYDTHITWDSLKALGTGLTEDAARFEAKKARTKVQEAEQYDPTNLRRYALRPFDMRWCYYSKVRPLWNEPRPTLWAQCRDGNSFLMCRPAGVSSPEGVPFFFATVLGDNDFLRGHAYYFPYRLKLARNNYKPAANLSPSARAYLAALGIADPDADEEIAGLIWMHALAIGYSPAYLQENADGIRQNWPRIPLPATQSQLLTSAALGRQIAALLDAEHPVKSVTVGAIRPELKTIAVISRVGGGSLRPDQGDLDVTAGWGHAGKGGVTMPGKGKVVEHASHSEAQRAEESLPHAAETLRRRQRRTAQGDNSYDVYLNDVAYWKNIPQRVWEYTIGGYQVVKKWLSYRERDLLGRALLPDEIREVTNMARRIAAIILLESELDANHAAVKGSTYTWPVS